LRIALAKGHDRGPEPFLQPRGQPSENTWPFRRNTFSVVAAN
jgi:hypothetical protein